MIMDARTLGSDTLETDICIVGAGPAGITLAHALRGHPERVMLLESGTDKLDLKLHAALNEGEVAKDSPHPPAHMYRQRRLGGATAIWGGRCVPYEPIDFEARPGLRPGWPIAYEEVARFFPRAMIYCEAGAADFDARTALDPKVSLVQGFDDPVVRSTSIERFSMPTNFGARWMKELVGAPRFQAVTRATGLRAVLAPGSDRIDHILCAVDGRRVTVRAKVFVVTTGGLETVRFLGASGFGGDKLGRGYMCHIEGIYGSLVLNPPTRPISWGFERTAEGVYTRRRLSIDDATMRADGLLNLIGRLHHENVVDPRHGHGVLSLMYLAKSFIIPEYRRKLATVERVMAASMPQGAAFWAAHLKNVVVGSPRVAGFTFDWIHRRYLSARRIPYVALHSARGVYPMEYNAEQIPQDESRVTLTDTLDRDGVPRLKIDWRTCETDLRSVASSYRKMRDAFARSGVGALEFEDAELLDRIRDLSAPVGGHHIGTARMSANPNDGVVDGDGLVHGVANLYVCGAATFPTSSHANPTLTIVATALRLAETLGRRAA